MKVKKKEQKYCVKLILMLRWLIKVFTVRASMECLSNL